MKYFDYRDERREINMRDITLDELTKFVLTYINDKESIVKE